MFDYRKPDEPGRAPVAPAAAKPVTPHLAYAAATDRPSGGHNHSIINEWLTMKGDLESEGDILVKGKVFGNINCKMLIVDTGAVIDGGIIADDVVIRGRIKGKIDARRVRLEQTAAVDGEIVHELFSAEEGARIKGALRFKEAGEVTVKEGPELTSIEKRTSAVAAAE
jgi:cytoskeletal protein CcmA (bactofilin family)